MPASRRTKFIIWSLLSIIIVSVGLLLSNKQPVIPLTLTFLGYSPSFNGRSIASFCMSNQSSEPVTYLSETPSLPYYYYMSLQLHDAKTGWTGVTNYRTAVVTGINGASLAPGGSITFAVPMTAGTSNVRVGVYYFPNQPPLHSRIANAVNRLLSRMPTVAYENLELRAPFEDTTKR